MSTEKTSKNSLLDILPIAIYKVDIEGNFVYANEHLANMLGYDHISELLVLNFTDLFVETTRRSQDKLNTDFEAMITEELNIRTKNGKTITVVDRYRRYLDDQENVFFEGSLVESHKDSNIHQQNKQIDGLCESIMSLYEYTDDAIYLFDFDGQLLEANPAALKLTGYAYDDLPTISLSSIVSSEYIDLASNFLFQAKNDKIQGNPVEIKLIKFDKVWTKIEPGLDWKGEFLKSSKNGHHKCEFATISPIFDNLEKIIGFILIIKDITATKEFAMEFGLKETKISALQSLLSELILTLDISGNILDIHNPSNSTLIKSQDPVVNKSILDAFELDLAELVYDSIPKISEEDSKYEFLFDTVHNDENKYYSVKMTKFYSDNILLVISDISANIISEQNSIKLKQIESMLSRWASEFINIDIYKFDKKINEAIADVGRTLGVDRVYLFTYDFENSIAINTHEWCNYGINPEIDNLKAVPFADIQSWVDSHLAGEYILIENVALLPKSDYLQQILEAQQIQTLLTMPMINNGKCIGFVGYDYCRKLKKWSEEEILLLKFLTELVYNLYDRIENQRKNAFAAADIRRLISIKEILSKWASEFISVQKENYDEAVDLALAEIGLAVDIDRIYVFKYDFINQVAINTHEWVKYGISPQIDNFNRVSISNMGKLLEVHKHGGTVLIEDIETLDDSEELKHVFQAQGTRSALGIPIYCDGNCLGFIGFDAVDRVKKWDEDEVLILKFMSDMLYNLQDKIARQAELEVAKLKAEESYKIKSVFLTSISHELRTPLTGIIGFAKFLANDKASEKEKESYIDTIIESSYRLKSIFDKINHVSMIEAGQMEVFNTKINLKKLLFEIYQCNKSIAASKNLEFKILQIGNNDNIYLVSDYGKLYHILSIVVDNAFKFTESGSVVLTCEVIDGVVEFSVMDTGIGISREFLPYIFDRLSKESTKVNYEHNGAGLGLAIAKGLSDLIDAKISVVSEINKGSKFTIKLLLNSLSFNNITKMRSKTVQVMDWKDSVILIAEDDEINFKYVDKLLSKVTNVTTIRARNGREAVDIALSRPEITLVLMDIKMPVLDGHVATVLIKEQRPDLPIIAVTAFAMVQDKVLALESGCDDYIAKPFEADAILTKINRFLAK